MNLTKQFGAAALVVSMLSAPAAAATFNFENDGPATQSIVTSDFTITYAVDGIFNFGGGAITQTADGLGISGNPDLDPGNIDGFPVASSETLIVTFNGDYLLESFRLGNLDDGGCFFFTCFGGDDFELSLDGVFAGSFASESGPLYAVNQVVNSFSLTASGLFDSSDAFLGNDSFTLAEFSAIEVAPVPLPAAGWMLLAGLGGLAAAKRRKTVSA